MPNDSARADYARTILTSAYDTNLYGLGVQKQLVWCLVNGVAQIGLRSHLQRALHAGADSDLLTNAAKYCEPVFLLGYSIRVANDIRVLKPNARYLEHLPLRALATGTPRSPTGIMGISMHEAMELFGSLAAKGYFSRSPSRHAVEKYMKEGTQAFERTLHTERVVFDRERLAGDMEKIMLGDAIKEYASFHAGKLGVMTLVTELADSALVKETGVQGRDEWFAGMKQDAKLVGEWKSLFAEDIPTPEMIVSSSRKVIKNANDWLGNRAGP